MSEWLLKLAVDALCTFVGVGVLVGSVLRVFTARIAPPPPHVCPPEGDTIRALRAENAKLREIASAHTITWAEPKPPKVTWEEVRSWRFYGLPDDVFRKAAALTDDDTKGWLRVMYRVYIPVGSTKWLRRTRGRDPDVGGWAPDPIEEGLQRSGYGSAFEDARIEACDGMLRCHLRYPNGAFVYPDEPIILRVHVEKRVEVALPEVRFIEVPVAVVPDSPEEQAERAAQAEVDAVLAQVQP